VAGALELELEWFEAGWCEVAGAGARAAWLEQLEWWRGGLERLE
jgi:hypothetical protein